MITTPEQVTILASALRAVPVGEIATYADLAALIGCVDLRESEHRYKLLHAVKRVEAEGVLFANVRGEGYQRLSSDRLHEHGRKANAAISRRAVKALTRAVQITNDLSPSDMAATARELSILGLHKHISSPRRVGLKDVSLVRPLTPQELLANILRGSQANVEANEP